MGARLAGSRRDRRQASPPSARVSLNLAALVAVGTALAIVTARYKTTPSTWPMLACAWTAWLVPLCSSVPSSEIRFVMGAWSALLVLEHRPVTRQGRLLQAASAFAAATLSLVLILRWAHGAFIG